MGTYKVPQNVEAQDKILGPLSMKQFVYAMIGVGYGLLTFALFKSVILLWVIVGVPPMLALLALGLYQKEDQSMEVYLIGIAQFITRPKTRLWQKEPIAEVFHLEPPPPKQEPITRDNRKARSQLAQLADIVDTRGWSVKQPEVQEMTAVPVIDMRDRIGSDVLGPNIGMESPEISDEDDILSTTSKAAADLDVLIQNSAKSLKAEAMEKMATPKTPAADAPPASTSGMTSSPSDDILKLTAVGELTVAQIAAQARRSNQPLAEGQQVSVPNVS